MMQHAHQTSKTGLQSFAEASADYDLAPVGLGSFHEQVDRLASFGRNGDIYVVHAAEGETVIPMEVLEANPQVKALLFNQMRDMGLDPNEYVVGDALNSINPVTGMPEFFFKSIFKAVGKAIKSVVKFVKKAAPIIIPIAASMFGIPFLPPAFFGIGSIGAAALGSGIGTLVGGGSLGDALKSGLMSGAAAGLFGGIKGALGGTSIGNYLGVAKDATFGSGLSRAFMNPNAASFSQNISAFGDLLSSPSKETSGAFFSGDVTPATTAAPQYAALAPNIAPVGPAAPLPDWNYDPSNEMLFKPVATGAAAPPVVSSLDPQEYVPRGAPGGWTKPPSDPALRPWYEKAGDWAFRGGKSREVWAQEGVNAGTDYTKAALAKYGVPEGTTLRTLGRTDPKAAAMIFKGAEAAEKAASTVPILSRYGPSTALAGTAAYAFGAFDPPERDPGMSDDEWDKMKAEWARNKLYEANPDLYNVPNLDPYRYTPPPVARGAQSLFAKDGGMMERQPQNMNYGGTAQYPRREMLVEGPGTERSDQIPAMLSDGEFVLNARSVRGADPTGQGNRHRGAQNLYNMMRNFEMKA